MDIAILCMYKKIIFSFPFSFFPYGFNFFSMMPKNNFINYKVSFIYMISDNIFSFIYR